jgi:hypothetical protein
MSELTPQTIKMLNTVSEIKGWPIEQEWVGDENVGDNDAKPEQKVPSKFKRFQKDWMSDESNEA